jgi:hypothetical protein
MALDRDGRLVHSRWVSTRPRRIPELGMILKPSSGEVYMYDAFTRPDARNKGLYGTVGCFAFNQLLEAGFTKVYGYVRSDNPAGLRVAKFWAHTVGRVWYLRVGEGRPWTFGTNKPGIPVLLMGRAYRPNPAVASTRLHRWGAGGSPS